MELLLCSLISEHDGGCAQGCQSDVPGVDVRRVQVEVALSTYLVQLPCDESRAEPLVMYTDNEEVLCGDDAIKWHLHQAHGEILPSPRLKHDVPCLQPIRLFATREGAAL